VGEKSQNFELLKFRSMKIDAEKNGAQWALQNDNRVTLVGRFIRKCRLDELPQIFNVLRGDMSFVGPRPERPEFVQGFNERIPYYRERHRSSPVLLAGLSCATPMALMNMIPFRSYNTTCTMSKITVCF